ncbi:MAG: hypothetical protein IRY99_27230, partial [Isosphaeraceae bacterium]|nr:hypothetical protein [Isosphaeraceae bacterium]
MFAHDRSTPSRRRRGVVLVLILAMLGLLAVIGVTFATFTSQAQVGARFYAQAQYNPDPEQVFDYALSQLINDTNNPVSFIRGHSIKRDMYGNDAVTNGYLTQLPPAAGGGALRIGSILASPPSSPFVIVTNIPTGNTIPALSGLKFGPLKSGATIIDPTLPGWTLRLSPPIGSNLVPQTFEVVADDISGPNHVLTLSPADMASYTPPGPPMAQPAPGMPFVLDGRYLRAFNGSGMSGTPPNAPANYRSINPIYPNFLFNRPDPMTLLPSGYNDPNSPIAPHMDEDYDAPDLENWFLALQSAD